MKLLNILVDNLTEIIGKLCSVCWAIIGIFCLYTAYELWQFSRVLMDNPLGYSMGGDSGIIQGAVLLFCLFGIIFLLYAVKQFKREAHMALACFLQKKVPGLILTILTYGIFIFLMVFFTTGEVSLLPKYARPLQIAGGILLLLDLCVTLRLFPDSWEESTLIKWIGKRRKG